MLQTKEGNTWCSSFQEVLNVRMLKDDGQRTTTKEDQLQYVTQVTQVNLKNGHWILLTGSISLYVIKNDSYPFKSLLTP